MLIEKLITSLPDLPFLVVIKITPFAALDPYSEVEAASFNTFTEAISFGLMEAIFPLKITPSTTYNGELDAFTEEKPLILIEALVPG